VSRLSAVRRRSTQTLRRSSIRPTIDYESVTVEAVIPKRDHSTITAAQAARKHLSDFATFAAAHDPVRTATQVENVGVAFNMVATLQAWLLRYGDALRQRATRRR
jgi:hypothetical protein